MYTFGDRPIKVEFLSDGSQNFHNAINETVNYEDPNLNISIPVYSIHGNHDDPSVFGGLSTLDLLSTTGLVNYFGRWTDLTKIDISPILQKGNTKLALYGLSHIQDMRLARLFESRKVHMQVPEGGEGEWFHLMVLHQNRADRGPKNYLPEEALPDFLNLVIWGHEHDCRIEPEHNLKRDFYVCQPGSTVPTSLAEGEALRKHVAILEIYKDKFQIKPIALKTVRPFVFESVNIMDLAEELGLDEGDASNKVKVMAQEKVEVMLERAKELITGHPRQPILPSIRLRLVFSDEDQMFNGIRLGQMFNDRVANPADMIHFKKLVKKEKKEQSNFDKEEMKISSRRCRTSISSLSNSNYNNDNDENMDDDVEEAPAKQTRASAANSRGGRTRGRGGKAKSASNNSNNSRSPAVRPSKHIMPVLETSRATRSSPRKPALFNMVGNSRTKQKIYEISDSDSD
ncbi:Double-strand break repair protein MRE11 [Eumeta japonica]|uniref:Double-strand break repair protein MRE11 n=1 Tax=Eumeta variegata TaxID=151549 RepID=A0A4C1SVB6_EUMVA|nr:Double-strand break repair protein MRE11 [Eumeta japonica]